jgi:Zn-dependent protease
VRTRVRLGRIADIPISLHVSWFAVFVLVVWATLGAFARAFPSIGAADRLAMALLTGLGFFACLLAHELAHSLVARTFGIPVLGITLFAFGGMAQISGEVEAPEEEFLIAIVGPALSICLGAICALIALGAGGLATVHVVARTLAVVNLGVGLFNLIPGLPLDGGRLLRSGLWRVMEDRARATRAASVGGYLLAAALVVLGVCIAFSGEPLGLWYVPVGVFLGALSRRSARSAAQASALALRHDPGHGNGADSRG